MKIRHYKFRIYHRYQSEIWGNVVLRNKKNKTLRMILKNFRYLKYLFVIKYKQNKSLSYYVNSNKWKRQKSFVKSKTERFYEDYNIVKLFWIKSTNFYKKIDIFDKVLNPIKEFYLKNKKNVLEKCFSLLSKLSWYNYKYRARYSKVSKKVYRKKKYRRNRKKYFKNNIFADVIHEYTNIDRPHYVKKKLAFWIETKLDRERLSLFFGLINKRRFIRTSEKFFIPSKNRSHTSFLVLGQLTFFLFLININISMYFIRNIIQTNQVKINKKINNNPFNNLDMFDDVSIVTTKLIHYYHSIKNRFKNKLVIHNTPDYVEFNYKIMTAAFWKLPTLENFIGPYDYPFKTLSFDWLRYSKSDILPRKKIYR